MTTNNKLIIHTNVKPSNVNNIIDEIILHDIKSVYIECDIICSTLILFLKENNIKIKSKTGNISTFLKLFNIKVSKF